MSKIKYFKRLLSSYILNAKDSNLSFWHGKPKINKNTNLKEIGQYYMNFGYKANYQGPFDDDNVPLLDYKGGIGKQYNPIAIAQYGLGNYNLYKNSNNLKHIKKAKEQGQWLINHLEENGQGIPVWMHHFNWEYRENLKAPWYSALAQGSGISLLIRLHKETNNDKYLNCAKKAFKALITDIKNGGVKFRDKQGNIWLEEYLVKPPSHVLNGFIWTLWGVYDFYLATGNPQALSLFKEGVKTIKNNLDKYDTGFWSLYELSPTKMKVMASPFYHQLHIVQLRILFKMTGKEVFNDYVKRWENYRHDFFYKNYALIYKIIFKLFYY